MARVDSLSIASGAILALAVAQAARAGTVIVNGVSGTTYTLSDTPAATSGPLFPSMPKLSVDAQGNFAYEGEDMVGTDVNYAYTNVYYYSAAGATPISVAPTDPIYASTSNGDTLYNTLLLGFGSNGAIVGYALRSDGIPFNYESSQVLGRDVFVYSGGSTTVVSNLGVLAATNTSGTYDGNAYYSFTRNFNTDGTYSPSDPYSGAYEFADGGSVNSSGQAIGDTRRYTGVANDATALGQDAWIYTPNAATPITILGLTDLAHTHTVTDNGVTYYAWTNTPVAINDSGSVIGTAADTGGSYTNDSGVTSATPIYANNKAGTDSWLYTPASGKSVQIGITGITITTDGSGNAVYNNQPAALGGYYSVVATGGGVTYVGQASNANAIYSNGVITGTTQIYGSPTNSNTMFTKNDPAIGQEAWIYTPSTTPGMAVATSSGGPYGTTSVGTYKQMGLLSGTSSNGYVYVASNGARSSSISAVDASGNAAGTSSRYSPSGTSGGADAWYYQASTGTTTNITPTAGVYSTYLVNNESTSTVVTMNNSGMVGGTQARYGTSVENLGADAWVYDSSSNTTYVIASPNLIATNPAFSAVAGDASSTEYFPAVLSGLTNSGMAYGYFTAYTGSNPVVDSSSTVIGTYAYVWTKATGTMIVSGLSSSNTVVPLNDSEWSSLLSNPSALTTSLFTDSAGDIYGVGTEADGSFGTYLIKAPLLGDANLDGIVGLSDLAIVLNNFGSITPLWTNGNFDGASTIDLTDLADVLNNFGQGSSPSAVGAIVPEPASLSLLAAGSLLLLRRRK